MTTERWRNQSEVYRYFASSCANLDFSGEAAEAMFNYESVGEPLIDYSVKGDNNLYNGFAVGKHQMDVTLAAWVEDIKKGYLLKAEILDDDEIPELAKIKVKDVLQGTSIWYDKKMFDNCAGDGLMRYAATDEIVSGEDYKRIMEAC